MNMARGKTAFKVVLKILACGGLALIGLGTLILLRTLAITAFGKQTDGTVIDNYFDPGLAQPSYYAIVRFDADGQPVEFRSAVGTSPPLHHVNDKVTVYYWPGDPEVAVIDGFAERYLRPTVASAFGLFFLALGGAFLWVPAWLARRRARIIASGVRVQAKVIAIRRETSVAVDHQSPWVIVAEFRDRINAQTVTCTSHYLWTDPVRAYPVGSEVTVYYLPDQPQKYVFQVDRIDGEQPH
jgi:hypothetical protein